MILNIEKLKGTQDRNIKGSQRPYNMGLLGTQTTNIKGTRRPYNMGLLSPTLGDPNEILNTLCPYIQMSSQVNTKLPLPSHNKELIK